ncbi:MAG: TauD/TfdA dioxygenase family protein [Alphaproteobacteria bacterium]
MTLRVVPSGGPLAADIEGIDLSRPVSGADQAAIERAWADHLVLRFRGQRLTDEHLIAFSSRFGELDRAPIPTAVARAELASHPEILVVSNIKVGDKPIGSLGSYEAEWHTDMSYKEDCPTASALYALEVPASGGDTGFTNMYLAYETLPAAVKARIENLSCRHDSSRNSAGELRRGFADVTDPREAPGAIHPLVRTHPVTRRRALFLGRRRNAYVLGLDLADSEALLDQLWAQATRREFAWYQQWQVGDLIMWDNRCTMHRRDAFDENARRLMHRTQIRGDRPYLEPLRAAS